MRVLSRKKLDQREKDLLISQLRELLSGKEPVLFAYLYGSFLGEGFFRDIDVAVYFDSRAFKDSGDMFNYSLALSAECDLATSGVTFDLRPLNLAPLPFRFDVVTQGRIFYTRDEERQVDFEARTRSLYFDFLPHLRFYYRNIVLGESDERFRESVLNRLFTEMDESLLKLGSLSKLSKDEFLGHYEKIDTCKYNFIVAIEAIIDICNRIISKRKLGFPQDYSDVIKLMSQEGVLEKDLVGRLIEMVKFRNMLVHLYWKIENDRLYKYLKENLGDFEAFKEAIRKYLKKSSS